MADTAGAGAEEKHFTETMCGSGPWVCWKPGRWQDYICGVYTLIDLKSTHPCMWAPTLPALANVTLNKKCAARWCVNCRKLQFALEKCDQHLQQPIRRDLATLSFSPTIVWVVRTLK